MPTNWHIKKRMDYFVCGLLKPHYPGIFLERQKNHGNILRGGADNSVARITSQLQFFSSYTG
jgi:hypothetical protein